MAYHECKHCSVRFWSNNKPRYCSPECREAGMGVECECRQCGSRFKRKGSRQRKEFCNRECQSKWRAMNRHKQTCHECGEQFTRINSRNRTPSVYCSHACAQKASRKLPRVECKCEACGREWISEKDQTVCSQTCRMNLEWGDAIAWNKPIQAGWVRCKVADHARRGNDARMP